jgi:biotin transport system substrate-specific component
MQNSSVHHRVLADVLLPDFTSGSKLLPYLKDIILIGSFVLIMTLSAQIVIKLPGTVVPITGQTFGALLAGGALGSRRGPISMVVYMLIGMFGAPIFAVSGSAVLAENQSVHFLLPWSGSAGLIWSMASGGYIFGFIFASYLVGKLSEKGWDRQSKVILSMVLGNIVIYAFGLPWLMIYLGASLSDTLLWGLWPFIPGDALKLVLASLTLPGAWALVNKIKK